MSSRHSVAADLIKQEALGRGQSSVVTGELGSNAVPSRQNGH